MNYWAGAIRGAAAVSKTYNLIAYKPAGTADLSLSDAIDDYGNYRYSVCYFLLFHSGSVSVADAVARSN